MSPDPAAAPSSTDFTIRPVEPADYDALARITLEAYEGNRDDLGDDYRDELRTSPGGRPPARCWLRSLPMAELLGGVAYVPGPDNPMSELERDGEAGIRMLAVDPDAQGLGVGRALTVACLDRAREEGRSGMALYTRPANVPAQRLYASLGFVRDPDRDWQYERGHWLWAFQLAF